MNEFNPAPDKHLIGDELLIGERQGADTAEDVREQEELLAYIITQATEGNYEV